MKAEKYELLITLSFIYENSKYEPLLKSMKTSQNGCGQGYGSPCLVLPNEIACFCFKSGNGKNE